MDEMEVHMEKLKEELKRLRLYKDPKRVVFRRASMLSTLLLFINILFSFYFLFKKLKGGTFAGV